MMHVVPEARASAVANHARLSHQLLYALAPILTGRLLAELALRISAESLWPDVGPLADLEGLDLACAEQAMHERTADALRLRPPQREYICGMTLADPAHAVLAPAASKIMRPCGTAIRYTQAARHILEGQPPSKAPAPLSSP